MGMKLGVVTDVHGNLAALEAVLERFAKEGIDGLLCCGDMISIGPQSEECVRLLMRQANFYAVQGNHERYFTTGMPTEVPNSENMSENEMLHQKWVHSTLSAETAAFLRALPLVQRLDIAGKRIAVQHYALEEGGGAFRAYVSRPSFAEQQQLFVGEGADIVLYGHDHAPVYNTDGQRHFINSGSLGCPSKARDVARAGLLTVEADGVGYEQVEVRYDVEVTLRRIREVRYPDYELIQAVFYGLR